jgi:hypothetical protein
MNNQKRLILLNLDEGKALWEEGNLPCKLFENCSKFQNNFTVFMIDLLEV